RGVKVAQTFEGNRATDVVVILDPDARARPEDLRSLPLVSAAGRMVTLSDVADVARTTGRFLISHQGARRVQTVTADAAGDEAGFAAELGRRLAGTRLPAGVYAELGGTAAPPRGAERRALPHKHPGGGG